MNIEIIANRFGGRLHIDSGESRQPLESIALVNKGNVREGNFIYKKKSFFRRKKIPRAL